jgi:glycosyltransferase involved in cell wall biosynthesis
MSVFVGKHILIVIENLPAPFDRRVWQEATTLKASGAAVSIICPKMRGYNKDYEVINGIEIYRHHLPLEGTGALGYLLEYSSAIFWEFFLSCKIFLRKRFHVIQGCNPPDLIFLTALFFKLFGVKYVFDHHDINPELYIAKFGKKDVLYKAMLFFEKLTFKTADYSIATNDSYREIAIRRGKMLPEKVQVIRSGPSLERLRIVPPNEEHKEGKKYLVGYVGVIGEQEGLDILLAVARRIKEKRRDVQFAILGGGTDLEQLKTLCTKMELDDTVRFYGIVTDQVLLEVLNTADVCVNPDKPSEMNNLSTMNKIMEYMALKKPIVQFDLKEGRASALDASLYVEHNNVEDFADKICFLLDRDDIRLKMGEFGYNRVVNELAWKYESKKLVNFYSKVLA